MNNSTTTNTETHRKRLDIIPKILCLVAAFVLWLYVTQIETYEYEETFKQIPVEIVNATSLKATSKLHVYSGYDNTVSVTVIGKRSDINKYTSQNIRVTADVSNITEPGVHSVPITAELPSGLSFSSMSLSSINVNVDVEASNEIPIKNGKITGSTKYEMDIETYPSLISITGPKTIVNSIEYAQYSLDFGNLTSSESFRQPLTLISNGEAVDPLLSNLILSREDVEVKVSLYDQKEVPFVIEGDYNDEYFNITCSPATITIKGDPDKIKGIDSYPIQLDKNQFTENDGRGWSINLDPPEGIEILDDVSKVTVKVSHVGTDIRSYKISGEDIKVTGLKNRNYTIDNESLTVKIRGPKDEIVKISDNNIKVVVDLSAYEGFTGKIECTPVITIAGVSADNSYIVGDYEGAIEVNIQ